MKTRMALKTYSFLFILVLICLSCRRIQKPIASDSSTLRVSSEQDPTTLDPRQVRDLPTATVIHMLYEGLMRIDSNGQPQPALAESVEISPDRKIYTFKLRQSAWSNGDPVTASDFEESWKTILNPNFAAPNAYQLYLIKGAKEAKKGATPLDDVRIRAVDDRTLVVELEQPVPYFLDLTAAYFYYPVSKTIREKIAQNTQPTESDYVFNGPFVLENWTKHNELSAVKNPFYWDLSHVHLDKIVLVHVENSTALQLFGRDEIDWIGSPLSTIPPDAIMTLKKKGDLQVYPSAATYLFRLNIEKAPLNHIKIRQALGLALNRQSLVDHVLQGNQIPALSLVPPRLMKNASLYQDDQTATAYQLLEEALNELKIPRQDLAKITLCYAAGERSHKIAQVAQQQWRQTLGLDVQLQSCESKVYYDRLNNQDYQVSIGSWFADIRDPISFLDVFKFKNNGTNNTQWENPNYIKLLNLSSQLSNPREREQLLKQAEHVLIREMPIIPLFHSTYNYLKQPYVKGVYFSELGYLDFVHASIDKGNP